MKTKKLNLFDVLIIIVIAVIVAGVFFRAEIRSLFFSDESSSFLMDVQITFLENSRASTVKDGMTVYDSDGKELGKITAISKTPSSDTVTIDGVKYETEEAVNEGSTVKFAYRDDGALAYIITLDGATETEIRITAFDGNVEESRFDIPDGYEK